LDNERLEQLLSKIYSCEVHPSDKLIQRTKSESSRTRNFDRLVGIAVLMNLGVFVGFLLLIIFSDYSIIIKGLLFILFSSVLNIIALLLLVYKEKIAVFFSQSYFLEDISKTQGGLL